MGMPPLFLPTLLRILPLGLYRGALDPDKNRAPLRMCAAYYFEQIREGCLFSRAIAMTPTYVSARNEALAFAPGLLRLYINSSRGPFAVEGDSRPHTIAALQRKINTRVIVHRLTSKAGNCRTLLSVATAVDVRCGRSLIIILTCKGRRSK